MQSKWMDQVNAELMALSPDRVSAALKQMNRNAIKFGATYRMKILPSVFAQTFWHPQYPRVKTSRGQTLERIGPNIPATAVTISREQLDQLERLGDDLYRVTASLRNLMLNHHRVRGTIGRSEQVSEMHSFNTASGFEDPNLMRIDYVWVPVDGELRPVVLDINLLPGYLVNTLSLFRVYENFAQELLGIKIRTRYRLDIAVRAIVDCYQQWAKHHGRNTIPRIAHVVREGHGLADEQRNLLRFASQLEPDFWRQSQLVFPSTNTTYGKWDLVIRQVREFWSRADSQINREEVTGIRSLIRTYQRGEVCVFPAFTLWKEDHQWAHWFRVLEREMSEILGSHAEWQWFRSCFPATSIVGDAVLITEDGQVDLTTDIIKRGGVLKRGDSTSAHQLQILDKPSWQACCEAYSYCLRTFGIGLVWQQFVKPSKAEVVALDPSGSPFLFKGLTKYSAYFVNGEHIGGNAMIAQAKKVHGGSGTLNAPVLIAD